MTTPVEKSSLRFLAGDGAMAGLIRAHDWPASPLGAPETWSQSLRSALLICLNTPIVAAVHWGPELRILYNDAYAPALAERHPWALGRPFREVWAEIWDVLGPHVASVRETGNGFSTQRQLLKMNRNGRVDDTWWVYSFAPLYDDDGSVGGIFVTALDETDKVLAEQALHESETRFRALVNASSDVVYRMSPDWSEMRQLDGRGFLADTGKPSIRWQEDYLFPEDRPRILAVIDEAIRTGGTFELEHRVRQADGSAGCTSSRAVPVRDDHGEIIEWFGMASDVTERRRTEDQLAESETRYRQIVEGAEEFAIVTLDPHGMITAWNRGAERLIGYAAEEAIGRPGAIFFTREDQQKTIPEHEMNRAATEGKVGDERWHIRKDGSRFWGSGLMMRLEHDDGYLKIFRDRTVEHEAEARRSTLTALSDALRDLEDPVEIGFVAASLLGEFLGVARVGYGGIDHEGETLHVARDWAAPGVETLAGVVSLRVYGTFIDTLKRGEFTVVTDVRDDPRTADRAALSLESQGARSFVNAPVLEQGRLVAVFFVNDDKVRKWSDDELALIREFADRTRTAVERAHATMGLRHLNETLETQVADRTAERNRVWTSSRDILVVTDRYGVFRDVNPAWTTILGHAPAEVIGHSFSDFVWPDDLGATTRAVRSATSGADVDGFENRYRAKDGTTRWITWRTAFEGELIYGYGRDVTAEKESAARLLVAEDALRQSQKMEAVGQLTGGIAHDFNNMLSVVMGSLDLLERRIGPEDQRSRRYVQAAAESAKRAANLTQRLLAFSRQQPLQPETLDINRLVSGMSDLLRHSIGAEIRLEAVLAGGLWKANVDPNQLENVILNLAVNARDAMPDGGRLTIETQNSHLDNRYVQSEIGVPAGQYVLIAVSDTGSGMPAEVIAKAFDPFFTTKDIGKGTGLGLSQAYGFVKQSGGHVKIYSEVGDGTSIKIYLPRSDEDILEPSSQTVGEDMRGEAREVILVVDDEPAVRQFSVDAFEELGYSVLQSESAVTALQVLKDHPEIALLFTDIVMPDVNGRKLVDQARVIRPDLKVLYTTGYTRNAVVHNGVVDKGVELIGKPFTIEELATRVRDILEG